MEVIIRTNCSTLDEYSLFLYWKQQMYPSAASSFTQFVSGLRIYDVKAAFTQRFLAQDLLAYLMCLTKQDLFSGFLRLSLSLQQG